MMNVLFVDDERNVLSGIRRMLHPQRKRWSMRFASSGAEALAILEQEPMDLIVSDIRMPHMTGVVLLRTVRARWPGTLRMVLSGESDPEALLDAVGPTHQYLCKPCKAEALVAALERMHTMLTMLEAHELRAIAGRFDSLPTPSTSYVAAVAIFDDPEGTTAELARVIGADVGMSTAILRVANSAFVGLSAQVSSVQRAIQLLGMDLSRAILTVAGVLRTSSTDPTVTRVLARSRQVTTTMRSLARGAPSTVRQQSELAAMLHNIGSLALLTDSPEVYAELVELPPEERAEAERLRFGTTQTLLGAYLLGVWGLPTPVMLAVAHQADSPDPSGELDPSQLLQRALLTVDAA